MGAGGGDLGTQGFYSLPSYFKRRFYQVERGRRARGRGAALSSLRSAVAGRGPRSGGRCGSGATGSLVRAGPGPGGGRLPSRGPSPTARCSAPPPQPAHAPPGSRRLARAPGRVRGGAPGLPRAGRGSTVASGAGVRDLFESFPKALPGPRGRGGVERHYHYRRYRSRRSGGRTPWRGASEGVVGPVPK